MILDAVMTLAHIHSIGRMAEPDSKQRVAGLNVYSPPGAIPPAPMGYTLRLRIFNFSSRVLVSLCFLHCNLGPSPSECGTWLSRHVL